MAGAPPRRRRILKGRLVKSSRVNRLSYFFSAFYFTLVNAVTFIRSYGSRETRDNLFDYLASLISRFIAEFLWRLPNYVKQYVQNLNFCFKVITLSAIKFA